MNRFISIIIVNYNGKKWLKDCLSSLAVQTYKNFEIIFVDNASEDDSVAYVKRYFPEVKIVQNTTNRGFAGGNNDGVKVAKGEYILLLNTDTRVKKDFLKNFIKAFDEIPHLGCAQSKLLLMDKPEKTDLVGAYWTDSSFLYYYGYEKDAKLPKYNTPMPFFSNKGASVLIRKDLIDKYGLFDDDFWLYYEETDFCHRLWLMGYECWYWPMAVCYHAGGGTTLRFDNSLIQFHNFKNKLMSFLKNFEAKNLLTIVSTFLFLNVLLSIFWLLKGKWKHSLTLYRAIGWNIIHLPSTLEKRNVIQKMRKVSDSKIFSKIKKNPKLKYYYALVNNLATYEE